MDKGKNWRLALVSAIQAGVLGLSGCAFTPVYEQPALPVSLAYPADSPTHDSTAAARVATLGWRDYFLDPALQELIAQALANNRDLRVLIARVDEARIAYGIRKADQLPTIGIGAVDARIALPGEINPVGSDLRISQYILGFNMGAWELDFWGRVRSLKDAALMDYLATDAARLAAMVSLIAQVADAYLLLRESDERIEIATQATVSRQKAYDMFKRRFEVGSTSRLEVAQSETLLTQAQALGAQLRQTRATQAHGLGVLTGTDSTRVVAGTPFNDDIVLRELQVGLPSLLLTRRPDIIAAEHRLKSANANIGAARAAFFPRIALNAAYGGLSTELNSLLDPSSRAWLFSPSISMPIFDGGRTQAGLELSEVRKDIAVANYEKTIQVAFREVSDALTARWWLTEQVAIQRQALAAQTERARLTRLRYDNGAASYFEVIESQRDLLNVQQQFVQVRRALLSSRVGLYAALGGGMSVGTEDGTNK